MSVKDTLGNKHPMGNTQTSHNTMMTAPVITGVAQVTHLSYGMWAILLQTDAQSLFGGECDICWVTG